MILLHFQLWYRVTHPKISMSKSRRWSRNRLGPLFGCHQKTSCDGAPHPPLGPCLLIMPIEHTVQHHIGQQCLFPDCSNLLSWRSAKPKFCEASSCKKLYIQGKLCHEWEDRPTGRRVAIMTCQLGSGGGKSNNPKSQWLPPQSLLVFQNVHYNTSWINFQSGLEQTAVVITGSILSAHQWLHIILPFF